MFNNFIREDKLELTGVNSRIDNIEEQQLSLSDNIDNLQAQIDGEVSSYFMEGTPRNNYRPSSEWTDNTLKQRHLGDTYTNILPYNVDLTLLDNDNKLFWFEKGSVQGNVGDSFDDMLVDNENHYRTKCLLTTDDPENVQVSLFEIKSISDSVSNDFNISIYYFNNNNQCVGTASGYRNGTENGFELLIDTTYHYAIIVFEVSDITDIRLQRYNNTKFINPDAGKSYRWCNYDDEDNNTWHWHPIADSDAIRALQKVDDLSKSFQTTIDNLSESFQTEIDNIEIGGRNLLTGSKTGKGWSQYTSFEDGIFYSENDTNGEKYIYSPKNLKLSKGTYTLSFDFKTEGFKAYTGTSNIGFQLFFIDGDFNPAIDRRIRYNELSTDWKHYIWTFDISEDCDGSGYIRFDNDRSSSFTNPTKLWIKNAKLEKGNKATDYSHAPEDNLPYLSGSTGSLLYHDGDEWVSSSTINDINDSYILTSGGGDFAPKWFESSIYDSDVKFSLLTYKNNVGLEWFWGPNGSDSILTTTSGGIGLAWNTLPLEDNLIYATAGKIHYLPIPDNSENMILIHDVNNGFCWSNMESIRGASYIHVMGEGIDDLIMEDPANTSSLVISFKFKSGDYTISTNGTIWYYNGTSFERGINLKS